MNSRPSALERAYELAQSGEFRGVSDIKVRLKGEGFTSVDGHLYGPSIRKELRRLCAEARGRAKDG